MAAQQALLDAKRDLEAARRDVDVLIATRNQVCSLILQPCYSLHVIHMVVYNNFLARELSAGHAMEVFSKCSEKGVG